MQTQPRMQLDDLSMGCPGLTSEKGATFAHAAAVCLEHNDHPVEVDMIFGGDYITTVTVVRCEVTEQMRRGNNDLQYATEDGAYGIAILAMLQHTGLTVVERAAKNGGFDWYLGTEPQDDFTLIDHAARLEVSGILKGDASEIKTRLKKKLKQTNPSDTSGLPAYAVIVEFGKPTSQVARK